jgi:hypothetical protein
MKRIVVVAAPLLLGAVCGAVFVVACGSGGSADAQTSSSGATLPADQDPAKRVNGFYFAPAPFPPEALLNVVTPVPCPWGFVETCVEVASGPFVLTDLYAPSHETNTLFVTVAVGDPNAAKPVFWKYFKTFPGGPSVTVTGARIAARAGEKIYLYNLNRDAAWSGFRP